MTRGAGHGETASKHNVRRRSEVLLHSSGNMYDSVSGSLHGSRSLHGSGNPNDSGSLYGGVAIVAVSCAKCSSPQWVVTTAMPRVNEH